MMFEAAPAWILLATLAVAKMVSWSESGAPDLVTRRLGHTTAWAVAVSFLVAAGWGVPNRWASYSWSTETLDRIQVPPLPTAEPSIVFVHSPWNERLSARLQGAGGMRQDSIASALRRNTNCQLHHYANAREARARQGDVNLPLPDVDLQQAPGFPKGLERIAMDQGLFIRSKAGETLTAECRREIQADRFGAVALAPLLWQGDLPGDERGRPLFVRDLGPETNAQIRALFPDRAPFVFSPFSPGASPRILGYEEAMRILWGAAP